MVGREGGKERGKGRERLIYKAQSIMWAFYYSHFTHEDVKSQRGKGTCLISHCSCVAELGGDLTPKPELRASPIPQILKGKLIPKAQPALTFSNHIISRKLAGRFPDKAAPSAACVNLSDLPDARQLVPPGTTHSSTSKLRTEKNYNPGDSMH